MITTLIIVLVLAAATLNISVYYADDEGNFTIACVAAVCIMMLICFGSWLI